MRKSPNFSTVSVSLPSATNGSRRCAVEQRHVVMTLPSRRLIDTDRLYLAAIHLLHRIVHIVPEHSPDAFVLNPQQPSDARDRHFPRHLQDQDDAISLPALRAREPCTSSEVEREFEGLRLLIECRLLHEPRSEKPEGEREQRIGVHRGKIPRSGGRQPPTQNTEEPKLINQEFCRKFDMAIGTVCAYLKYLMK